MFRRLIRPSVSGLHSLSDSGVRTPPFFQLAFVTVCTTELGVGEKELVHSRQGEQSEWHREAGSRLVRFRETAADATMKFCRTLTSIVLEPLRFAHMRFDARPLHEPKSKANNA